MKRICIFFLALAGLAYFGLLPFRAHDVAQLLPVETVIVTRDGGQYCVDIGAGVRAVGRTLSEALDRLQEQVSGVLFFQTAEQVIVTEAAADAIPAVAEQTRFRRGFRLPQDAQRRPDRRGGQGGPGRGQNAAAAADCPGGRRVPAACVAAALCASCWRRQAAPCCCRWRRCFRAAPGPGCWAGWRQAHSIYIICCPRSRPGRSRMRRRRSLAGRQSCCGESTRLRC